MKHKAPWFATLTKQQCKAREARKNQQIKIYFTMLQATLQQAIYFAKDLTGEDKMKMNDLLAATNVFITQGLATIPKHLRKAVVEQIEEYSAGVWQILNEFAQCQDKRQLLTLMKAFNAGEVYENETK